MRYARNRREVSPACFFVEAADGRRVPEHEVWADPAGHFVVVSARSGETYHVSVEGDCRRARDGQLCESRLVVCSHLTAVLAHAAAVLEKEKR